MPANQGMLGFLNPNALRQEELDEEKQAMDLALMDPFQAAAHATYSSSRQLGKGIGRAVAGVTGADPRTPAERQVEDMTKAKAAISAMGDVDLNTPEGVDSYYKGVIGVLRQHNLPAEAHAAALEWNEYKSKSADRKIKEDELARKKAADAAKASTEQAKVAASAERNRLMAQRGLGEFVGWIDRIEKTDDPATKALLIQRANAEIESKKKGITLEPAGDRVIVRDKATGAVLGTDIVGEKPLSAKDAAKDAKAGEADALAYRSDMQGLQTVYKAAADLYNSPGLDDLIGKWTGIAAEQGSEKGGIVREGAIARLNAHGQEALGLFQQVQGASFLKALKDLKAAGKGSTGLGAVSEVEGNKIQAANGSLFPRQQPASFRRKLADFIDTIEASANNLAVEARKGGVAPIHLNTVALTGPTRRGAAAPAPTTPRSSAQSTVEPTVPMTKDGKTRNVLRSKVEEAKRRGYTEIK